MGFMALEKVSKKTKTVFWAALGGVGIIVLALLSIKGKMFIIPDNMPITLENYQHIFLSNSAWSHFLNIPTYDQSIFIFRQYIFWLSKLFSLELGQGLLLGKILFVLSAGWGMYLLGKDINRRFFDGRIETLFLIIGAILYALAPAFLIADSFWVGIQFGYYIIPLILFSVTKIVLDGNWVYLPLYLWLLSLNNAIHYTYGGYPALIGIFCLALIIGEGRSEKIKLVRLAMRLTVIAIGYLLIISPNLVGLLSPDVGMATQMTKQSIDAPWSSASFVNVAVGMSSNNLILDYYSRDSLTKIAYGFLAFVPMIALISLLFLPKYREAAQKYYRFLLAIIIGYMLVILCFSDGSIFKFIHYSLAFDAPMGRILRTTRVTESFVLIALALIIPFSLHEIKRYSKIPTRIMAVIGTLVLLAYITPVLKGDINGPIISVPKQYLEQSNFLKTVADPSVDKTVAAPEFTASYGKDAVMKPHWSPNVGMIAEFLGYSQPIQAILTLDNLRHYYYFTVSDFYKKSNNLIFSEEFYALAHFLSLNNVRYLMFHADTQSNLKDIEFADKILDSKYWQSVYTNKDITVFENQVRQPAVSAYSQDETSLVSGGYRSAARFINQLPETLNQNRLFAFLDQGANPALIGTTGRLITDKTPGDLNGDIMAASVIAEKSLPGAQIIFPAEKTKQYAPESVWSTGTYANNHEQEWHRYVNEMDDYAWDFDWGHGILFINRAKNKLEIPIENASQGQSKIHVRYLKNDKGGDMYLNISGQRFHINSISPYDGFGWASFDVGQTKNNNHIILENSSGFNAVSTILIIDDKATNTIASTTKPLITNAKIIDNSLETSPNISRASGFESPSDMAQWRVSKKEGSFTSKLDTSQPKEGKSSLVVQTSGQSRAWSWIEGPSINVEPGEKYVFRTNIKLSNAMNSHIALIGKGKNGEKQLTQLPGAISGTSEWQSFRHTIKIPSGVTSVRVALNAGWAKDKSRPAKTWFDAIKLNPLTPALPLGEVESMSKSVTNLKQLNNTRWEGDISLPNNKPVFLAFNQSFDPGWKLFLAPGNQSQNNASSIGFTKPGLEIDTKKHFKANGINNGWEIDPSSLPPNLQSTPMHFVIEYWPQRSYLLAQIVEGSALLLSVAGAIAFVIFRRRNKHA